MYDGTIIAITILKRAEIHQEAENVKKPCDASDQGRETVAFRSEMPGGGVDTETELEHSLKTTSANIVDLTVAHKMFRKDNQVRHGDSAYSALAMHKKIRKHPNLFKTTYT